MAAGSLKYPSRIHSRFFDSDEAAFRQALTNTAVVSIAALEEMLAVPVLELVLPVVMKIAMKPPGRPVLVAMKVAPSVLARVEPIVPAQAEQPAQPAPLEVPQPDILVPLSTKPLRR